MHYTTYGDTNLRVSVAGLGAGGFSRLGLGTGGSQADAVAVVHAALDRGINLIDTAAAYGTEEVVGKAIGGLDRSQLVLATKAGFGRGPDRVPPETVIASLDRSLRLLGTDYIDIFQIHAVSPERYDWVHGELVPALLREKAKGKFRHLGITETPPFDPGHAMLQRAIPDGCWESVMVAFHMLHQNARAGVFPATTAAGVGTMLMFVVRGIFAQPERLSATLAELRLPELDFLVHPGGAHDMVDAAYRFARYETGVDVVLFGTGSVDHVHRNVESLLKPPLPEEDVARLRAVYGHVVGVGLDVPTRQVVSPIGR